MWSTCILFSLLIFYFCFTYNGPLKALMWLNAFLDFFEKLYARNKAEQDAFLLLSMKCNPPKRKRPREGSVRKRPTQSQYYVPKVSNGCRFRVRVVLTLTQEGPWDWTRYLRWPGNFSIDLGLLLNLSINVRVTKQNKIEYFMKKIICISKC